MREIDVKYISIFKADATNYKFNLFPFQNFHTSSRRKRCVYLRKFILQSIRFGSPSYRDVSRILKKQKARVKARYLSDSTSPLRCVSTDLNPPSRVLHDDYFRSFTHTKIRLMLLHGNHATKYPRDISHNGAHTERETRSS